VFITTLAKSSKSMYPLFCESASSKTCIRQHTSAYVSIRPHTSAYVKSRLPESGHTLCIYLRIRQLSYAYASTHSLRMPGGQQWSRTPGQAARLSESSASALGPEFFFKKGIAKKEKRKRSFVRVFSVCSRS
jgi:hypothetical protein